MLHPPSLMEFAHEFIGHYVALEGKLWRTLGKLFFVPGELTREYLHGRKLRYVLPLRLYLTVSFVFFVVLASLGGKAPPAKSPANAMPYDAAPILAEFDRQWAQSLPNAPDHKSRVEADAVLDASLAELRRNEQTRRINDSQYSSKLTTCDATLAWCAWMQGRITDRLGGMTRQEMARYLKSRVMAYAPYAIFLLLPVLAALIQCAYWSRKMFYGEHLVFALHIQAFYFFTLAAVLLLPESLWPYLGGMTLLYTATALQRVFGGRWWTLVVRSIFLAIAYTMLVLLVALLVMLAAVFL